MNKEEIISSGLLESYVMGQLSHEETLQVEWWAKAYPEVHAEIAAIEDSMKEYAFAHAEAVSSEVKKKLFSALDAADKKSESINDLTPPLEPAPIKKMYSPWKALTAAAAVLLAISLTFNWIYADKYSKTETALQNTIDDLSKSQALNQQLDKSMGIVQNKYSLPVALDGLPVAPDAAAKIFWMKNTGEVYVDPSNLPAAPDSMQYQLWAIVDGKPVDGGMITLDTDNGNTYGIQKMKTFGKAEAFAITLESKGGNPQPKGDMYVIGKL